MSTHSKANLARIRDNQRRSRARRREYVQDLEQRLRVAELQGVEASAEVQVAARRVAEENRVLRDMLHRHGISDEFITHHLQQSHGNHEAGASVQLRTTSNASNSIHTLQQAMLPRRAASLDQNATFPLPSQTSREPSSASASTVSSAVWDPSQAGISPVQFTTSQPTGVSLAMATATPPSGSYPMYSGDTTTPLSTFPATSQGQMPGHILDQHQQQHHQDYTSQQVHLDPTTGLPYQAAMDPFGHPTSDPSYRPPGAC